MLKQQIQADQIVSMKAKDTVRLDTLRYILAQIKNIEIDTQKELDDSEVITCIRKEVKKLQDSITAFENAGREDLASEYEAQKKIMLEYLPTEMSDDELKNEIQKIMTAHQELAQSNPNAMIGICIKELKGKVESSRVATMIRSLQ